MHASENQELYDRHHKVSPTLILTKTHIILSSMKSYETAKRPVLYEVPNANSGFRVSEKVVAVAYERLLLTRGSKHSELTGKTLIFCRSGHFKEVIYERWLYREVQLTVSIDLTELISGLLCILHRLLQSSL